MAGVSIDEYDYPSKKCFVCKGHIQGEVFVIAKSHMSNADNYTVNVVENNIKYFHPPCLSSVAGKKYVNTAENPNTSW